MEAAIFKLSSMVYYCLSLRLKSDTDSIFTYDDFREQLSEIVEENAQNHSDL